MNLNFLVKAAQAIVKGGKIVMPFVLGITSRTPSTKDDAIASRAEDVLSKIGEFALIAQTADEALLAAKFPGLSGEQKGIMIYSLTREVLMKSELMIGKEIIDEARAEAAMKGIQSNIVELLKSVKEK